MADFEFEIRRRDGEVRTMMESSIAVRDAGGHGDGVPGISAGHHRPETRGAGNPAAQSRIDGAEFDRADAYGVDGLERLACTGRCGRSRNCSGSMRRHCICSTRRG